MRVYETSDPNLLLVKESAARCSLDDYAIERDEGLVADLKLFGRHRSGGTGAHDAVSRTLARVRAAAVASISARARG